MEDSSGQTSVEVDFTSLIASLRQPTAAQRLHGLKAMEEQVLRGQGVKPGAIRRALRLAAALCIDSVYSEASWKAQARGWLLNALNTYEAASMTAFLEAFADLLGSYNLISGPITTIASESRRITAAAILLVEVLSSQEGRNNINDDYVDTQGVNHFEFCSKLFSRAILCKSTKHLHILSSRRRPLYEKYVDAIIGKDEQDITVCSIAMPEKLSKTTVIEFMTKKGLVSKSYSDSPILAAMMVFIKNQITDADWTQPQESGDSLEAAAVKSLKKAPEGNSGLIATLVSHLRVDLSNFVTQGANVGILKMLKSTEDNVRVNGLVIIRELNKHVSREDAIQLMLQTVLEAIQGKGGLLNQPFQRISVASALAEIAEGLHLYSKSNAEVASTLAASVVGGIIPVIEKEVDESAKSVLATALGKHIAVAGRRCDFAAIVNAMSGKARLTVLAGVALSVTLSPEVARDFQSAMPLCINTLKDAFKKAQQYQPDAILSWKIASAISTQVHELKSSLDSVKAVDTILLSPNSLICNSGVFTNLAPSFQADDTSAVIGSSFGYQIVPGFESRLLQGIVVKAIVTSVTDNCNTDCLGAIIAKNPALLTLLLKCASHSLKEIREASNRALTQLVSVHNDARGHLLHLFFEWLREMSSRCTEAKANRIANFKSLTSSAGDDDVVSVTVAGEKGLVPAASKLRDTLNCLCDGPLVSPQSVGLAMLIAGHEFVGDSIKRSIPLLRSIITTKLQSSIQSLSANNTTFAADVTGFVFEMIGNSDARSRRAGQVVLTVLTQLSYSENSQADIFTSMRDNIYTTLGEHIKIDEISEIPEDEVERMINPEKIISATITSEIAHVDVRITNADRKKDTSRSSRRGQFGNDVVMDEDWANRVMQEKAAKISEATEAATQEIRARVVAEIDAIRAKHATIILSTESTLETLQFVATHCHNSSATQTLASRFSQRVAICIRSLLVQNSAISCQRALAHASVETELQPLIQDLMHSYRIVAQYVDQPLKKKETEAGRAKAFAGHLAPIQRVVKELQVYLARLQASKKTSRIATSAVFFPVIRGVALMNVASPVALPGCEHVFSVLNSLFPESFLDSTAVPHALHRECVNYLQQTHKELMEVCLKAIGKVKTEPQPESLLLRVTSHRSSLRVSEWSPLIGDTGMLHDDPAVRQAALRAVLTMSVSNSATNLLLESRLWLLRFDDVTAVQELANRLWNDQNRPLSSNFYTTLCPLLSHNSAHNRRMAAKAIAGGMKEHPANAVVTINKLQELFVRNKAPVKVDKKLAATKDGKVDLAAYLAMDPNEGKNLVDSNFTTRGAIAMAFGAIGEQQTLSADQAQVAIDLLTFILREGVIDPDSEVRGHMVTGGRSLIDKFGAANTEAYISLLRGVISETPKQDENLDDYDNRHEAAVILLGAAGKHLSKDDPNIFTIADSLVEALKTPSESVQSSVAESLSPLIQVVKTSEQAQSYLEALLDRCLNSEDYGERRGAAYGLSAVVKGLGITCLKQHDVVGRLRDACEKGSSNARQGSLAAFECLCDRLGLLFEPYVITIIPALLKSFSHGTEMVREAAQTSARVIMNKLSAHGIKQIMNPVMGSLSDPAWKTRQEAVRLLGSMAHCAPKQLAACLPQVIPKLVECGTDAHPKVKESARSSLGDISSVIKNPEISRLSPILLAALADPALKTKEALEALLECEFMHSIDATSLAILVPILSRALKDRSADLKRKSSAITGNMTSMVGDAKLLLPYVPPMLAGLKECLVDPIPDVRATSAKALGSIVGGVGEEEMTDVVPWLMTTLSCEASPVERSGAAQGLAEVGLALGGARLDKITADIFALQNSTQVASREGLMWYLCFLPPILTEKFAAYLSQGLPIVLEGLSDENEGVREVSMRSGQIIVQTLGRTHATEIVPNLVEAMFNDDWRIRLSSVKLLGDLLCLLGDVRAATVAEAVADEDGGEWDTSYDGSTSTSSRVITAIRNNIGENLTRIVLASLYIVRSDVAIMVRQSALQVWKSVVYNTPKTLVEILTVLVDEIIAKLSSSVSDLRLVAGRALGEIVSKQGDRVLPAILPYLKEGLNSAVDSMRQGICLGLAEIVNASSKRQIEMFTSTIIVALQQALCDSSNEVRSQAGRAFNTLHKNIGETALKEIVPSLLNRLNSELQQSSGPDVVNNSVALLGLREIVQARPKDLLEFLVPRLTKSPITRVHAMALAGVAQVAGPGLQYQFSSLLPALAKELSKFDLSDESADNYAEEKARFEAVRTATGCVVAATTTVGVNFLVGELGKLIEHETKPAYRRWGCVMVELFAKQTQADFSEFVPIFIKYLMTRVADSDTQILTAVSEAMGAIVSVVPMEELVDHIDFMRNCLNSAASDARHRTSAVGQSGSKSMEDYILPLFTIPKSVEPFLSVYIHGLMNGSVSCREYAADAMGEVIAMCDPAVLKPFLIKTTGPLIRVAGDRYPSSLKAAIIETLGVLLDKGSANLKAFAPQLQTTFVKSLNDPAKMTRSRACQGLGKLMPLLARVDPLLNELSNLCVTAESIAIRASILEAISIVLSLGGEKATPAALEKVLSTIMTHMEDEDEATRLSAAKCFSGLGASLDTEKLSDLVCELVELPVTSSSALAPQAVVAGRCVAIGSLLETAHKRLPDKQSINNCFEVVSVCFRDERTPSRSAACQAVLSMINVPVESSQFIDRVVEAFASGIATCIRDSSSSDLRKLGITISKEMSKKHPSAAVKLAKDVAPPMIAALSELNLSVKYLADRALFHMVGGRDMTQLTQVAPTLDGESARFLRDYAKRILCKMAQDSDDEGGGW